MRRGRETRLPQRLGGEQPAKSGRVLQDLQIVPGIEQQRRPQHGRQLLGFAQHDPPFVKPLVFVPVES